MHEQRLADVDLRDLCRRRFHPSPTAWEDQVLYFLLPDRFSDGNETGYRDIEGRTVTAGSTPLYHPTDNGNAIGGEADAEQWREAGCGWVGGNLKGIESKLGYLKRLGVTAIWIGPVFKQVPFKGTYHGYGVQNFLDVDPNFGSREELRELVAACHANEIHVILDTILNHAGDVFGYDADRHWTERDGKRFIEPRWDGREYAVRGYRDPQGQPTIPFGVIDLSAHPEAWPDGGVWPAELQQPWCFARKGCISNWNHPPEFREGDFGDMKDVDLGAHDPDHYRPTDGIKALCRAYEFWIAYTDADGFRVDTVKHMGHGPTRYLTSVIHEFAQSIGKENFCLIGEVTGGRGAAFDTVEKTGLDAALGIDDVQDRLARMVKGRCNPMDYFGLFTNSLHVGKESHAWFRNKVVTQLDDHDKVTQGECKSRYCALDDGDKSVLAAIALNLTTLGIPCTYYGTEQGFDGRGGSDRYIREAMCGGDFGAFRSKGRHCFDESHPVYVEVSKMAAIRRAEPALRRGRQYLREISGDGVSFGLPEMVGGEIRSVVPWSRMFADQEVLLAINTDVAQARQAHVTVDSELHREGDALTCLYSTDPAQINSALRVEARNGKSVLLRVPAAGFVICK